MRTRGNFNVCKATNLFSFQRKAKKGWVNRVVESHELFELKSLKIQSARMARSTHASLNPHTALSIPSHQHTARVRIGIPYELNVLLWGFLSDYRELATQVDVFYFRALSVCGFLRSKEKLLNGIRRRRRKNNFEETFKCFSSLYLLTLDLREWKEKL